MRRNHLWTAVALALGCVFIYGLADLMLLRLKRGDVFPPYSSLRADPFGTKAFREALSRPRPGSAAVSFVPLRRAVPQGGYLLAGLDGGDLAWPGGAEAQALDRLARDGARIVLTLDPASAETCLEEEAFRNEAAAGKAGKEGAAESPSGPPAEKDVAEKKGKPARAGDRGKPLPSLCDLWGFALACGTPPAAGFAQLAAGAPDLPASVAWRSGWSLKETSPEWRILYEVEGRPVVATRPVGKGSVLLCADSYFLSNEGLRNARCPGLLAFVAGEGDLRFDETHLGVEEDPGVIALARRYRLHGLGAALLVLVFVYLWMVALPFVPPCWEESERERAGEVAGENAAAGLENLLGRSVPEASIVSVCFSEWRRSLGPEAVRLAPRIARTEDVLDRAKALGRKGPRPAQLYNRLVTLLSERNPK